MSLISVPRSPGLNGAQSQRGDPNRPRLQKRDSFIMVQGSALLFPERDVTPDSQTSPQGPEPAGRLQRDLQDMCDLLRPEDCIKLAIQLESLRRNRKRYFLIVSNNANMNSAESIILGVDISSWNGERSCTIGLVFPIWGDTFVFLDGDGGFSVSSADRTCIFKPLNIQAMWTVLQALHNCCQEAMRQNLFPSGGALSWSNDYAQQIRSAQNCINEWHAMSDLLSIRPPSPPSSDALSALELTEKEIARQLRNIMAELDYDKVTSKEVRVMLEQRMEQDLSKFRGFVDNEIILTVAQMDRPSRIFNYLYLGTEWNASNLQELEENGVGYILNVTREIDNFFPEHFQYLNIRVYDEEETDLLSHWEDTYRFISKARAQGSRCLVHCKMGVSRSASTVIAFAMKEKGWDMETALKHVKERRRVVKPNSGFLSQLHTYQGIIEASKQRHNTLWKTSSPTQDAPSTPGDSLGPSPRPPSPSPCPPPTAEPSLRPSSPSPPPPRSAPPESLSSRPESTHTVPPREEPPSSPPRPTSPTAPSPRPSSPDASSPRPSSPSSPSALSPRPSSPDPSSPRPSSPSSPTAPLPSARSPRAALLRAGSLSQQRIDLLSLMRQLEEREEEEEELEAAGRHRGWKTRRAFSLQGPDLRSFRRDVGETETAPGSQRQKLHLFHSDALDLQEEEDEEKE